MNRDWARWHDAYEDPSSPLSIRLTLVQRHLADALTAAPQGPVSLVSLCAGQGRDVLGVLPGHPRRDDVKAVLVELDPRIARQAAEHAEQAGLPDVEVRAIDAGRTSGFADALPAGVLMLCGIFGNVSDADIRRTVAAAPELTAPGGTVIWTRHRREPDLTPALRDWFAAAGFTEVAFEAPDTGSTLIGIGVHRRPAGPAERSRRPTADIPGGRLFTFTDSK
ncbi:MAG: SAM-dependent methyltransferase [Actinobacteria bacterium]|nr:SAM-dependent methyltransferase [Actinomycetota bacterium]MBO0835149.1 SAM-dependent methyltransferase [Actinomycetota bacterium]